MRAGVAAVQERARRFTKRAKEPAIRDEVCLSPSSMGWNRSGAQRKRRNPTSSAYLEKYEYELVGNFSERVRVRTGAAVLAPVERGDLVHVVGLELEVE